MIDRAEVLGAIADTPDAVDRLAIVCNYTEATSVVAFGAKAYVVPIFGGNLPERVKVLVRSRGSRWIVKWENMRRLDNFRLVTLPPEHPRYADDRRHPNVCPRVEQVEHLFRCKARLGEAS